MDAARGGDAQWVSRGGSESVNTSLTRHLAPVDQPAISAYVATHPRDAGSMTKLVSFLAREPSLALAFNYASLILNTSYFLENLVSCVTHRTRKSAG